MTNETTTEQLAEIEGQARIVTPDDVAAQQLVRGLVLQVTAAIEPEPVQVPEPQAADTAATEYTPPEGYRVLQIGEVVQKDDIFLAVNGEHWPAKRIGETVNNNRYIRRIEVSQPCAPCDSRDNQADYALPEGCRNDGGWSSGVNGTEPVPQPEPQPEPQPQLEPEPVQYTPPEGWRVLEVGKRLRDGDMTVRKDGYCYSTERVGYFVGANQRYIRRIEPEPQPKPEPQPEPVQVPEPQAADTAATKYTPPEGWRVLEVGELLQGGDEWVNWEGTVSRPDIQHGDGATASGGRYIRRIKPEPQTESEPEPVQVREGRWRTRRGDIRNVTPTPECDNRHDRFPWRDTAYDQTWAEDGRYFVDREESPLDLVEYLGPIEQQPEPQPEPHAAAIEELRSEVSYVQRLFGESRQRVTQLEELVASLRTINEAQEEAVEAAGKENTALRNQLTAVKAELASVAADRQRLRVELDAAQQVPADSPELRQLRADLEQATLGRDTYRDGYNRVLSDLRTIRETTTADTVETIAEWLQAFRGCNSPALALLLLEALPSIMRSLTGLEDEEIE